MLASIRPDEINIPLFIHVLGAMVLVGGLVTTAGASIIGWNDESPALRQFAYKVLLFVALPGWILMRIGAQWVYVKEGLDDLPDGVDEPAWVMIGGVAADVAVPLLLIALIGGGIGLRRSRSGGGGDTLLKVSSGIATFLLVVYVVAVWAMGAKPT